jgi:hypothetical protein
MSPWMQLLTGLRWNRPRRWPRKIRSTTQCSDLSVRGSLRRDRGGLRKISLMVMTVSKKRSINGLPQRDIETISCSTTRLASASPVQQALPLIAHIGQWRSRANTSHRRKLQARERRLQQKENRLYNLAESQSSVSAFDPPRRSARNARRSLQIDLRSDRKPARTSSEKSCGCSHAA